jgi:hypothetical protein
MGPSGAAGNWASAGTPLLGDKRGVPVARPRERQERKAKTKHTCCGNRVRRPRRGEERKRVYFYI